jgi:hypothetical protein
LFHSLSEKTEMKTRHRQDSKAGVDSDCRGLKASLKLDIAEGQVTRLSDR